MSEYEKMKEKITALREAQIKNCWHDHMLATVQNYQGDIDTLRCEEKLTPKQDLDLTGRLRAEIDAFIAQCTCQKK